MPYIVLQPTAPGSQVLLVPDGTEALPGLAFNTDTSLGIYKPANNVMGFSVAGAEIFRLNVNGGEFNDGKALYFVAADGSGTIGMLAPAAGVTTYNFKWPVAQGAANTLLKNDGAGNLSYSKAVLTTDVSGILPIANGGTNNNAVLNNNRVMVSTGGTIAEAAAITASRVLASDANGIPVALAAITANRALISDASGYPTHSATTNTELGYLSGVTSSVQTQLDAKIPKSTLSAKGSLVGSTAASTPADVPVGTDEQVLEADSSAGIGVKYGNKNKVVVQSKSADFTSDAKVGLYLVDTTSAVAVTAHASPVAGQMMRFRKTTSDLNACTIYSVTTINTINEEVLLVYDGSAWKVIQRHLPDGWTSYTPTGGWNTNVTYTGLYRREKNGFRYRIKVALSGAPNNASLTINQPTNHTIDNATTEWPVAPTANQEQVGWINYNDVSDVSASNGPGHTYEGTVRFNNTTSVVCLVGYCYNGNTYQTGAAFTTTVPFTWANGDYVFIEYWVPISGFKG